MPSHVHRTHKCANHHSNMSPRRPTWAFTIIEILIVISICAIILSLTLPALETARATAQSAICASNQRQMSVAFTNYSNAYKGVCPMSTFINPVNTNLIYNDPNQWYDLSVHNNSWGFHTQILTYLSSVDQPPAGTAQPLYRCPSLSGVQSPTTYAFPMPVVAYASSPQSYWSGYSPALYPYIHAIHYRANPYFGVEWYGTVLDQSGNGTTTYSLNADRNGQVAMDSIVAPSKKTMIFDASSLPMPQYSPSLAFNGIVEIGYSFTPRYSFRYSTYLGGDRGNPVNYSPQNTFTNVGFQHASKAQVVFCDGSYKQMTSDQLLYDPTDSQWALKW